jgi:hypothetical protein
MLVAPPEGHEARLIGMGVLVLAYTVIGSITMYRGLWSGQPASRWLGFLALVALGAFLIWFANWQTTLDFPNAAADERIRMQEDTRAARPWTIAWGAANFAAGAMLLFPQVGQFLHARREGTAPPPS